MGQCGCGDYCPDREYALPGVTVALQVYRGCSYCHDTVEVIPYFFTPESDWPDDPESVTPDEYGGVHRPIPIIGVDDLRAAIKEAGGDAFTTGDPDGYDSLDDWLQDEGLRILQDAVSRCARRINDADNAKAPNPVSQPAAKPSECGESLGADEEGR